MATKRKSIPTTVFRIYQDRARGWRWRLVSKNGRIVGDSAESYTRQRDAIRAALRVGRLVQGEPVGVENSEGVGAGWCIPLRRFPPRRKK